MPAAAQLYAQVEQQQQQQQQQQLLLLLLLLLPFNGLFSRTTWVSRCQKGEISPDANKARDAGVLGCSGISWSTCKQSATPTPHR